MRYVNVHASSNMCCGNRARIVLSLLDRDRRCDKFHSESESESTDNDLRSSKSGSVQTVINWRDINEKNDAAREASFRFRQ